MIVAPIQTKLYEVSPMLNTLSGVHVDGSPLTTGVVLYLGGFLLLTAWERFAVPALKLNSILPDVPLLPGDLREQEKRIPWITPATLRTSVPPPTKDELRKRRSFFVGNTDTLSQFITLESRDLFPGACERSPEWSEYYEEDVCIYKVRR